MPVLAPAAGGSWTSGVGAYGGAAVPEVSFSAPPVVSTDPNQQFMNPVGVVFTPASGGAAVTIAHVSKVTYHERPTSVSFSGDTDLYVSARRAVILDPEAVVSCLVPAVLDGVQAGTVGTLTWTAADPRNGDAAGGGGVLYTLAHAVFMRRPVDHSYRTFSRTDFLFQAFAPDGSTSPLTATPV